MFWSDLDPLFFLTVATDPDPEFLSAGYSSPAVAESVSGRIQIRFQSGSGPETLQ